MKHLGTHSMFLSFTLGLGGAAWAQSQQQTVMTDEPSQGSSGTAAKSAILDEAKATGAMPQAQPTEADEKTATFQRIEQLMQQVGEDAANAGRPKAQAAEEGNPSETKRAPGRAEGRKSSGAQRNKMGEGADPTAMATAEDPTANSMGELNQLVEMVKASGWPLSTKERAMVNAIEIAQNKHAKGL